MLLLIVGVRGCSFTSGPPAGAPVVGSSAVAPPVVVQTLVARVHLEAGEPIPDQAVCRATLPAAEAPVDPAGLADLDRVPVRPLRTGEALRASDLVPRTDRSDEIPVGQRAIVVPPDGDPDRALPEVGSRVDVAWTDPPPCPPSLLALGSGRRILPGDHWDALGIPGRYGDPAHPGADRMPGVLLDPDLRFDRLDR